MYDKSKLHGLDNEIELLYAKSNSILFKTYRKEMSEGMLDIYSTILVMCDNKGYKGPKKTIKASMGKAKEAADIYIENGDWNRFIDELIGILCDFCIASKTGIINGYKEYVKDNDNNE